MKTIGSEPSELEVLMMSYNLDISPVFEHDYKTGKHYRVWFAGRKQLNKVTGINSVAPDDFVKSTTDCGPLEVARQIVAKLKTRAAKRRHKNKK